MAQTFDAVGNLVDDGRDFKYIYDAFGRLVEVTDQSDNTVAAYGYNGLNHRISWHYDVTGSGGGPVPDGSVDGSDPVFYFVYNERWQHVATYRGSDSDPKEQFLYHAAGVAGSGSSSYVDAMLLRDDHDADWDAAADSTLERRVYYVQNWRWDIVALLADNGRVLERAWHEPYGTPHGLPAADLTTSNTSGNDDYGVPDGDADADDQGYFDTLHAASSTRADLTGSATSTDFAYGRPDGTVDADDSSYYTDIKNAADTLGRGALSAEDGLRNRRGLSGYEWDPTHDKYHVRHRVLRPETGRWTRRDPAGYVDGVNLYAAYGVLTSTDPSGLANIPPFDFCLQECHERCGGYPLYTQDVCFKECKKDCEEDYGGGYCCNSSNTPIWIKPEDGGPWKSLPPGSCDFCDGIGPNPGGAVCGCKGGEVYKVPDGARLDIGPGGRCSLSFRTLSAQCACWLGIRCGCRPANEFGDPPPPANASTSFPSGSPSSDSRGGDGGGSGSGPIAACVHIAEE